MNKLIALVDGSIYSASVCDNAAWIAGRTGAGVEVLHVLGRRETSSAPVNMSGNLSLGARTSLLEELASLDEQRARLAQKRGRAIVDDACERLKGAGVQRPVTKLRFGDIVETVAEQEAEADLIVVGKRGEAADFASGHLGSNLERIVRVSRRPVFVAARAFRPIRRFLVAYDGGASSMKAVDEIARNPLFAGLECRVVMAGAETEANRRTLEKAKQVLHAGRHMVQASLIEGQPEVVISQMVDQEGVDLIVMGAYGHSRIRTLIIGSTTTAMIRSCRIPIVLFR